jgi:hypothetical protein
MLNVGDRVRFPEKIKHYDRGWPVGQEGVVACHPYAHVWYVELDRYPLSRVPVVAGMVEKIS